VKEVVPVRRKIGRGKEGKMKTGGENEREGQKSS
jgi:hypothetical protein